MPFVDWITIKQRHNLDVLCPEVHEGLIATSADYYECPITGDVLLQKPKYTCLKRKTHEGSFDTSLQIRSSANEVFISGNVGRWGRPDNVFNFDFDGTVRKANDIASHYGLPAFCAGEKSALVSPTATDIKLGRVHVWTGATVSNLHITENYITGSPEAARSFIGWLSSQSVARVKQGRVGSASTSWGSKGGRKLLKAYIKADEMLAHCPDKAAKEKMKTYPVYRYAHENGLVRVELEAHRKMLIDEGMRFLGDITMAKVVQLFHKHTEILRRVNTDFATGRADLSQLPPKLRLMALAHFKGEDTTTLCSRATWYRHAKALRGFGIDLSSESNVRSLPVVFRVQDVKAAEAPHWYWHRWAA